MYMKKVLLLLLIIIILLFIVTEIWLKNGKKPIANGKNEYAIILGAKVNGTTPSLSLQYRLDAAISYAEKYPATKFILSGGQGDDEEIPEARSMFHYLVEKGVPSSQLIIEDQSTTTYENIKFSSALLPDDVKNITIISSDYHLARAQKVAKSFHLDTDVVIAKTPKIVYVKSVTRERLALLKYFITRK